MKIKEAKMSRVTRYDIVRNYQLWRDYVDPSGYTTEEEFKEMSIEEKEKFYVECFGEDEEEEEE